MHGEVKWGREKLQRAGCCFCLQREDRDGGGVGENMGKAPPPQKQLERKWKLETAAGTKLKRDKGERRKERV